MAAGSGQWVSERGAGTSLRGSTTGPVHAGRYTLDLDSPGGTTLSLAARGQRSDPPPELVQALASGGEDERPKRDLIATAGDWLDKASAGTDKVENATGLLRSLLEGRIPEGGVVAGELDDILGLVARLEAAGRFEDTIRVGRLLCRAFGLTLRWAALVESLRLVLHAGTALADTGTTAWADHELGTLHAAAGNTDRGRELLQRARTQRAEIGDHEGLEATEHNLKLLSKRFAWAPSTTAIVLTGCLIAIVLSLGVARAVDSGSSGASTATSTTSGGGAGAAKIVPSRIEFGSHPRGSTSAGATVTLSNPGPGALLVRSVVLGGNDPSDFKLSSNSCAGRRLAPARHCRVVVTFIPAAIGSRAATLTFAQAFGGPTEQVTLSGTGTGGGHGSAQFQLAPGIANFGSQAQGTTSSAKQVMVKNTGTATVTVQEVSVTGTNLTDFSAKGCIGQKLPAGQSCSVDVTFTPGAMGSRTATLTVAVGAGSAPETATLAGIGTSAACARVSSPSVALGDVPVGEHSTGHQVSLHNCGQSPLSVSVAVGGANQSEFAIVDVGCTGQTVPAGGSCTVTVIATPASAGPRDARLAFSDGAGSGSQQVALSVVGSGTSSPSVSPSPVLFAPVTVGSSSAQTVTLSNDGTAPMAVGPATVGGDFTISSDGCSGQTVQPHSSCMVTVTFAPPTDGSFKAILQFPISGSSPATTELAGSATPKLA